MPRPDLSRIPDFFHKYVNLVKEDELMQAFKNSTKSLEFFFKTIPAEKHDYRYADDKWTIKDLVQHIIDAERIFSYRALRFARKDTTPLPGFDENLFAENAKAYKRNWNDLMEEFSAVRKSTEILFASFDQEQLESEGNSNGHSNYVLGMGFICVGHCNHHRRIIEERYL
jgi:uncharacterized damage-inducible protein DinB